ncbi:MAG: hypothetical protein QM762_09910 [Chryseolinea sp.]
MPKAVNNNILKGVSGKLGDNIVIRQTQLGTIVANKPKRTKPPTEDQVKVRDKFSDAAYYAREEVKVPESLAMYQAAVSPKLRSPYSVAIADYLSAPRVRGIDSRGYRGAVGDLITVRASDDFKVMSVMVVIKSATGEELERGEATFRGGSHPDWTYATTVANASLKDSTITAIAKDLPGNEGTLTVTL